MTRDEPVPPVFARRYQAPALVRGYEPRIAGLVLAAAIEARAEAILTFNARHFPAEALVRFGLIARNPDALLRDLKADPEAVLAAVDAARLNLSRTAPSAEAFIDAFERQRLIGLAARLRSDGRGA
jgi:hypothetical protein